MFPKSPSLAQVGSVQCIVYSSPSSLDQLRTLLALVHQSERMGSWSICLLAMIKSSFVDHRKVIAVHDFEVRCDPLAGNFRNGGHDNLVKYFNDWSDYLAFVDFLEVVNISDLGRLRDTSSVRKASPSVEVDCVLCNIGET